MNRNNPKNTTAQVTSKVRCFSGHAILVGGLGAAVLLAACERSAPSSEATTPTWQQQFEPVSEAAGVPADQAAANKEAPEPAPTIEVAIAHEESDDFEARARALTDDGDLAGALEAMRKHLHTVEPTADHLLVVGRLARQVKELKLAKVALDAAAKLDARRSDVLVELARVHMDAGQPKKAERVSRRALRVNDEDAPAWNQLGRAVMAQSRWDLAERAYKRSIHLDPVDGLVQNNLGLLYIYRKDGPKAVEALERAVELLEDETPYFVFNNLGLAHELSGQNQEAREAFEEALLLNPFYTRAKVNLDRVEARIAAIEDGRTFKTAEGTEEATPEPAEPGGA